MNDKDILTLNCYIEILIFVHNLNFLLIMLFLNYSCNYYC